MYEIKGRTLKLSKLNKLFVSFFEFKWTNNFDLTDLSAETVHDRLAPLDHSLKGATDDVELLTVVGELDVMWLAAAENLKILHFCYGFYWSNFKH